MIAAHRTATEWRRPLACPDPEVRMPQIEHVVPGAARQQPASLRHGALLVRAPTSSVAVCPTVVLRPGRERPIRLGHPWVYSGAVASLDAEPGAIVDVLDHRRQFVARGYCNPASQIVVRVLTRDPSEALDERFWRARLEQSLRRRDAAVVPPATSAFRLVFAESDGLPGLIVDRYGDWLVLQALTLGIERRKQQLAAWLAELAGVRGIFERSDDQVRDLEGLPRIKGNLLGEEPPERLEILEHGCRFWVDLKRGQKTGFYLDQRENRQIVRRLAEKRRVLNVFAYSGGFTVAAIAGDAADTVTIEASRRAVALAVDNLVLNGYDQRSAADTFVVGDAFRELPLLVDQGSRFDLVILDPPRFARSAAQLAAAARGYREINRLGFQLLQPGGLLVTFSCSSLVTSEVFQRLVLQAALQARVEAQILARLSQPGDHPVALAFPESSYLKGLVCRRM